MDQHEKSRQEAAGAALAAKRSNVDASTLEAEAREMYDTMDEIQLEQLAGATHGVLPEPDMKTDANDLARGN